MQKNPYLILGINENATEQEIERAYYNLRSKYSEDRFLPGDEGRLAAEKLSELDEAYEDVLRLYSEKRAYQNYGSSFGEIESLIKSGQLDNAQSMLDNTEERSGEWHYLQSIIFYRKNWYTESLKQLEFAMKLEPNNTKYSDAHTRLKNLMNGPQNGQYQGYNQGPNKGYQSPPPQQGGCCSGTGAEDNCCMNMLCASCLCQMCSGGCR